MEGDQFVDYLGMLACPLCEKPLTSEISQCSNGHIICKNCQTALGMCPLCLEDFVDLENPTPGTLPVKREGLPPSAQDLNDLFYCPFNASQRRCCFWSNRADLEVHLRTIHYDMTLEQIFEAPVSRYLPLTPSGRLDIAVLAFGEIFHCYLVTEQIQVFLFIRYLGAVEKTYLYTAEVSANLGQDKLFHLNMNVINLNTPEEDILQSLPLFNTTIASEDWYKGKDMPIYFEIQIKKGAPAPLPPISTFRSPLSEVQLPVSSTAEDTTAQNSDTIVGEPGAQMCDLFDSNVAARIAQILGMPPDTNTVSSSTDVVQQKLLSTDADQAQRPNNTQVQNSAMLQISASQCSTDNTRNYEFKHKPAVGTAQTYQNQLQNPALLSLDLSVNKNEKEGHGINSIKNTTSTVAEQIQRPYQNQMVNPITDMNKQRYHAGSLFSGTMASYAQTQQPYQNQRQQATPHVPITEMDRQRYNTGSLYSNTMTSSAQTQQAYQNQRQQATPHVPMTDMNKQRYNIGSFCNNTMTPYAQTQQAYQNQRQQATPHVPITEMDRQRYNTCSSTITSAGQSYQNRMENFTQQVPNTDIQNRRFIPNPFNVSTPVAANQNFMQNTAMMYPSYSANSESQKETYIPHTFNSRTSSAAGQIHSNFGNTMQYPHAGFTGYENEEYSPYQLMKSYQSKQNQMYNPGMLYSQNAPITDNQYSDPFNSRAATAPGQMYETLQNQIQNTDTVYPQHEHFNETGNQNYVPYQFNNTASTSAAQQPELHYTPRSQCVPTTQQRSVNQYIRPATAFEQTHSHRLHKSNVSHPQHQNEVQNKLFFPDHYGKMTPSFLGHTQMPFQTHTQNPAMSSSQGVANKNTENFSYFQNTFNRRPTTASGQVLPPHPNQKNMSSQHLVTSKIEKEVCVPNQMSSILSTSNEQPLQQHEKMQNPSTPYQQHVSNNGFEQRRYAHNPFQSTASTSQTCQDQMQNSSIVNPEQVPITVIEKRKYIRKKLKSRSSTPIVPTHHPYKNQKQCSPLLYPEDTPSTYSPSQFKSRPLTSAVQKDVAHQKHPKNVALHGSQKQKYLPDQFKARSSTPGAQTHQQVPNQTQHSPMLHPQNTTTNERDNQKSCS